MLQISGVSKRYQSSQVNALDNISLSVEGGQLFGFLGPNGAGKTTAIKLITGILGFEQGSIKIFGNDLKNNPIAAKRCIGYVPDNHTVYDKLTGREYINYMADVYGVDIATRKRKSEELLHKFQLEQAFDKQIKSYSHGMNQKISIMGALLHEPRLWILDEPMTGLDPQAALVLRGLMTEHCQKGNIVFFSTHVLEVAEKICSHIGIIAKGKIIMTSPVDKIRNADSGLDQSLEQLFLSVVE